LLGAFIAKSRSGQKLSVNRCHVVVKLHDITMTSLCCHRNIAWSPPYAVSVPVIASPRVQLIGWTHFEAPADVEWDTDADGGQALAEFAGRACYQSWHKPNPTTATNAGYLRHILEVGHLSVLEHGTVTFYLTGMSRSLTHELIRHRHFSYSQLSQRYVPEHHAEMVEPEVIAEDPELHSKFVAATDAAVAAYTELLEGLERKFEGAAGSGPASLRHKQARHADVEIRALAISCLRQLQAKAGNVFADFEITALPDGTEVASSPMVSEG
jgi:thymidylate synthase (FAD)